jgi:sugar O-acyltransferase (sialic acid O-acetyltransferase NeuD family)
MNRPGIILLGAGGHARACIEVVESQGKFVIDGLVGLQNETGQRVLGYSVVATDAQIAGLSAKYPNALIAVGQIRSPEARIRLFSAARDAGFNLPTVISPAATVSQHASIGAGTIVMHGAIVNAGAQVGENCIINSRALVEHDAIVGSHCHISTGAILNGGVSVGGGSFVGSGSVVRDGIHLADRCFVVMGAVVRQNQVTTGQVVR